MHFQIDWSHAILLCASSLTTASLTSLVLSTTVICVVLISRSFAINPDNIATPIAASLGDLTTLGALSLLGNCPIQVQALCFLKYEKIYLFFSLNIEGTRLYSNI